MFEGAGVDADEGETADVSIGLDLKGQTGERRVDLRLPDFRLVGVGVDPGNGTTVERRGKEIDDGIKQGLDAFVAQAGAGKNGNDGVGAGSLT